MRVTVRLFARLREIVGQDLVVIELDEPAVARDVWSRLAARHPALEPFGGAMSTAVNAEYAKLDSPVSDGDEVAFLPPVSGG